MKRLLLLLFILFIPFTVKAANARPVDIHGNLNVQGTNIVDKNGNVFQLRGVSTHGIGWFPQYVNQDAFNYMRDEWGINAIRLAMYSDPNCNRNEQTYELVKKGVEYAKNAGLYVIIDWHILNDSNPNIYKSDAIDFFKKMANLYKDYPNVLYEICNEPNGNVTWDRDIKPYALDVIKEIREIDKDAIIIIGTPTWSQDVDIVSKDPIKQYNNLVYALHFYAGDHKDNIRNKMNTAINNGLPILVSEFGLVKADGNGSIDEVSSKKWFELLDENKTGYFMWNLSNKNEGSAMIKSNVTKTSGWTYDELSDHGKYFYNKLKTYPEEVEEITTSTTIESSTIPKVEEVTINEDILKEEPNTIIKIVLGLITGILMIIAIIAIIKTNINKNSNN